jgi:hypothetical protein
MAELGRSRVELAMNTIAHAGTRRWNGLVLGIIVVAMGHLSAATNTGGSGEPWPVLLSSEPASTDPGVTLLQQRAQGSLDKLLQPAGAPRQPL